MIKQESKEKDKIYGIVDFPMSITCSKELLGKSSSITVGGVKGVLNFPLLPNWTLNEDNPLDKHLLPPEVAKTWKRGSDQIFWGKPLDYPMGTSCIYKMLMIFEVQKTDVVTSSNEIYRAFPKWIRLFDTYIELLTRQIITIDVTRQKPDARLDLLRLNNEGRLIRAYDDDLIEPMIIRARNIDAMFKPDQFSLICKLCSSGLQPALEYRIMLEAYRAFNNEDLRKAVIESATAAEIVITKRIKQEFTELGLAFGEKLLKKFRMLGGRIELARLLDIDLPDRDYLKYLIDPRNEVIDKADFPKEGKTAEVIKLVEELLMKFSPNVFEEVAQF
jgi:hypothetical protein